MRTDSHVVTFGGVSELQYDLSDAEKQQKLKAASAPLEASQQVWLFNQEVKNELQDLRQESPALADLDQVRKLICASSGAIDPIAPMEHDRNRDSMAESMSKARQELMLAESLVNSTGPTALPEQKATTQRPNTWSNVPVELSAEEQEEIRHRIYGSLVGMADESGPKHRHPMDAEESARHSEQAEASRLRAALMRFDQDDAHSNSSFLSDADVQVERDRSNMASQLERMAYETERSRLQDAEQLAADEQELQRLKAEIERNKQNVGVAPESEHTAHRHQLDLQVELAQAKNELSSVHREEATLETMRAKEVDLLQQTLKASQRRCSALGDEVQELREKLERTGGGRSEEANTEELEAELAKEKALRERYAALCVKLEKACESPGPRAHDPEQVDTEALKESVVQAEEMLREAEFHARQRLAEAEHEIATAKESAESFQGQAQDNAERLQNAELALAAAERRSVALQEEKQATEEAMALSVGAQEEQISSLTRQLEEAQVQAFRSADSQASGRVAQLQESLRSATEQTAVVERKLARSEQSTRELSRRAEQAVQQTQEAVASQQAAERALRQAQANVAGANASQEEQEAALRRAAAAEAEKRRLQQELGIAHRQQAAQKAELERLNAQLAEMKKSARAAAAQKGREGAQGQPSPQQKQKEDRLAQAQKQMEGQLRKAKNDLKGLQKRNTELLSEVQAATAAAQAANAEVEARSKSAGSMRLPSTAHPYDASLHPGRASSLALLSHSSSSIRSARVPQSTWGSTAAAVAAAVCPDRTLVSGADATVVGWESRDSAKASIEGWLDHALDVVGASVHITTRDERKEWSALTAKLGAWMNEVTARMFFKVATDEELAVLAAATHSTLQITAGPDLKRPDVLKVVDTLGKIFRLLERLAERERELQLWARAENGGKQACTVIAGVLFHSLDIVHASVLVTPQTQRVRLAEGISQQLTRIEHGLGEVLSSMPEDELLMLTKLLLEIEHFELVEQVTATELAWISQLVNALDRAWEHYHSDHSGISSLWRRLTPTHMPTERPGGRVVEAATDTTEVAADPRAEVPQEPVEENNHRLSPRDALAQARAALEVAEAEAESIRLSRHTKLVAAVSVALVVGMVGALGHYRGGGGRWAKLWPGARAAAASVTGQASSLLPGGTPRGLE